MAMPVVWTLACTLTLLGGCAAHASSELYGFSVPDKSYNLNLVRIDVSTAEMTILATVAGGDGNAGTTSKDAERGVIYNSIRDLADNSFSLFGFEVSSGKQTLQVALPSFHMQAGADVGRPGSGILTAYDPASDKVICTGPTSFDGDGYFTVAVYTVDVKTKAVAKLADLPGGSFIEAVTRAAVDAQGQLLLTYAPKSSHTQAFYAVDLKTGAVTQHSDSGMFYLDFDSKSSRVTGFCGGASANGASSCTLDTKTWSIAQVAPLALPGQFNAELEMEYAFDSATGHACWQLAGGSGGDQNYLVCHDFESGKVVNASPAIKSAIGLIFLPSAAREVEIQV